MERLDEFQSVTTGYGRSSSLKYQTDYYLLVNACVRYGRTKKANIAKRGHIYQTSSTPDNDGLVMKHSMKFIHQVMSFTISIQLNMFHQCQLGTNFILDFLSQIKVQTHSQRNKPNRDGLVLSTCQCIYTKLLSQDVKDALQKYNVEAIQKFKSR